METRRLKGMDDVLLDGKRVLVRVDFNVASNEDGVVDGRDDYRIRAALPTIEELMQRRCKVLLVTHRGRPQEGDSDVDLEPVQQRLEKLLKEEVKVVKHLAGSDVEAVVSGMEQGSVAMLPNVRLDEREESGNEKFAAELAEVAEVYVNEAFSVLHRDHASVSKVPRLLPACAGRRTVHEYEILSKLVQQPERPYVAVVSGAKVHTKINLLSNLLKSVDKLCLGGVIANAFLAALGKCPPGQCGSDSVAAARYLWKEAADKIVLPEDVVIGPPDGEGSSVAAVSVDSIPEEAKGIWDIGPASEECYLDILKEAQTIMWNGPLGMFEVPAYAGGTASLAEGMAEFNSWRVIGGGDTIRALDELRLTNRFDHISVGGGAMVAFLGGEAMPGLEVLYS